MPLSPRAKGLLFTLAGVVLLIPDALLVRLSAQNDWTLIFWRGGLASCVFSLIILMTCWQQKSFKALHLERKSLLLAAFLAMANCTFVISMLHTKVANVLIIIALAPMFSALFDLMFRKLSLARRTWIAIFSCLLGVFVLVVDGIGTGSHLGNSYALLTAIALGAEFSLMGSSKPDSIPAALGLGYLVSALVAALLAPQLSIPTTSLSAVLPMGLIVVPIAFFLISKGPQYLPAPEVALFLLLETVCGPLLVWLVLDESPGRYALIGGSLVIATLIWHSTVDLLHERKNTRPCPPPTATLENSDASSP